MDRLDNLLMRFTDVIYAFPDLLFIILLSVAFRETAFGQALDGLLLVFVAIGLTIWVTVARLVRGQMLALKETEFVEAAQAIGVRDRRIVTRHLLPNGIGPIIVAVTLGIPAAILAEATLAYIGIGVQPPRASWGSLIAEGRSSSARSPTWCSSRRSPSRSRWSASRSSGTACATRSIRSSRASSRWRRPRTP